MNRFKHVSRNDTGYFFVALETIITFSFQVVYEFVLYLFFIFHYVRLIDQVRDFSSGSIALF